MVDVTLRNRVRECRLRALIVSQAELARLTGMCRTTVCAIEKNRINLTIVYAFRLKKVLKCSLDDLYEEVPCNGINSGVKSVRNKRK